MEDAGEETADQVGDAGHDDDDGDGSDDDDDDNDYDV